MAIRLPRKPGQAVQAQHPLAWAAPTPFWGANGAALKQPQILRFASDEFMDELLALLQADPASLVRLRAVPETWREPAGATPVAATAPAATAVLPAPAQPREAPAAERFAGLRRFALARARQAGQLERPTLPSRAGSRAAAKPLKLYQPAHLRHYLVAGTLVCETPGLPDRQLDAARQGVGFVLRRLLPRVASAPGTALPDIQDRSAWDEFAWVPEGKAGHWQQVAGADDEAQLTRLVPGEERLPVFPARYVQDSGLPRRLFVGSVPVGRRETYQGGQARKGTASFDAAGSGLPPMDARVVQFQIDVLAPWKNLVGMVMRPGAAGVDITNNAAVKAALQLARPDSVLQPAATGDFPPPLNASPPLLGHPNLGALRTLRSSLQTASWYLLLDLMKFLKQHLPQFWDDHVASTSPPSGPGPLKDLYDRLDDCAMPADLVATGVTLATASPGAINPLLPPSITLRDQAPSYAGRITISLLQALRWADERPVQSLSFEAALEAQASEFSFADSDEERAAWPDFLFLFADPWFGVLQPPALADFNPPDGDYLSEKIVARIDSLAATLAAALPATPASPDVPEPTLATMVPTDLREAWYVMRLVHERPSCAPFHGSVISAATVPFQMAGFFDPDAPARPVRIGLPLDVSPAGLRKFDKNAVFVLSDMLCGHVDRFKGMTLADLVLSVLPWPFHKDLPVPAKGACKTGSPEMSLGVMCSLSIPIVTICALILLMIIISLLDFVFRWIPWFIVCFPLPGLKGKKDGP